MVLLLLQVTGRYRGEDKRIGSPVHLWLNRKKARLGTRLCLKVPAPGAERDDPLSRPPRCGLLAGKRSEDEKLMPDLTLWGLFVVASVVLLLTPGPAVLYVVARWATKTDPQILKLLLASAKSRSQYDPAKFSPITVHRVKHA